jgi:hypothetical protein
MSKKLITTIFIILFGQTLFAQSLVPATSDDLNDFDRQISKAQSSKNTKENFGAVVSDEAKSLKNSDLNKKKAMGKWVSDQKSKEDQKVPSANASKGQGNSNANSNSKDARTSSPANNDHGNSSNAPGHNK